jgi:hypothetical protein
MPPVNPRLQARMPDRLATILADRSERMLRGDSESQQALAELGLWFGVMAAELGRIRLTLSQALCIADVCNGWVLDATCARPGLVFAECYDAFRLARDTPLDPDLSSYGRKHGPEGCDAAQWEKDLLDYLAILGPAADCALRDAINRWWQQDEGATVDGFGNVGLHVREG